MVVGVPGDQPQMELAQRRVVQTQPLHGMPPHEPTSGQKIAASEICHHKNHYVGQGENILAYMTVLMDLMIG